MPITEEENRAYVESCERLGAPLDEVNIFKRGGQNWLRWKNRTTPMVDTLEFNLYYRDRLYRGFITMRTLAKMGMKKIRKRPAWGIINYMFPLVYGG